MHKVSSLPKLVPGEKVPGTMLTALRPERETDNRNWWFRCDCGVEKLTDTHNVRCARTKSCGCHRRKNWDSQRQYTPEMEQIIREKYPTMGRALAKELGVKQDSLGVKARKMGLSVISPSKRAGKVNRERNRNCNHDFFKVWTPELAYVLGYIWADGCITTQDGKPHAIHFACTENDRDLLEQIKRVTGAASEMKQREAFTIHGIAPSQKHKTYECRPAVYFKIHSADITEHLVGEHGIVPRKSRVDPPYPLNVPDELLSHFARGNMDGDGSVFLCERPLHRVTAIQFLGSHRFIDGLAKHISRVLELPVPSPGIMGKIRRVRWGKRSEFLKLHEWLYRDATIFLKRKKEKADRAVRLIHEWNAEHPGQ